MRPDEPNADFHDVLRALVDHDVRFLVVGAHALAAHGIPRATQDLDLWIDGTPSNAARVWRALVALVEEIWDSIAQEANVRPDALPRLVAQVVFHPAARDELHEARECMRRSAPHTNDRLHASRIGQLPWFANFGRG